jgi:DNA (cytosine-5)-methyltransferase 1
VWNIDEEKRHWYRGIAQKAHEAKRRGRAEPCARPAHEINVPGLRPEALMPVMPPSGLTCLSLFCGGGGLDIGFEAAGFVHAACYEILPQVAGSLSLNRPSWAVYGGESGDVTRQIWGQFSGIDVMVGGPPCQPYSQAGQQHGKSDVRDMIPTYVQAIKAVSPAAFVLENVPALLHEKFRGHLDAELMRPLDGAYHLHVFTLDAAWFGVPQARRRAFIIGFRSRSHFDRFTKPRPTHRLPFAKPDLVTPPLFGEPADALPVCMGARQSLGLPEIGFDALAPTIRSGMTGPRYTTSVVSGQASQRRWTELQVWPHGVNRTRAGAQLFPTPNGYFRLSVPDCAVLQGFPGDWRFPSQAYLALGIIGNSVCPPVAYNLAKAIRRAFG